MFREICDENYYFIYFYFKAFTFFYSFLIALKKLKIKYFNPVIFKIIFIIILFYYIEGNRVSIEIFSELRFTLC